LTTFRIWPLNLLIPKDSCLFSSTSLLDYLETVPDSRIRLSKLIGTSILGPISMWIAFPSSNKVMPGANWYDQIWDKNDFGGYKYIDEIISVSPCKDYNKIFIQIGAHLGIFPLVASYRGCLGIAVEPIPAATNFTRISAKLNNWGEDKFLAINAVGSSKDGGFMWFDPKGITVSGNDGNLTGKVRIPVTTLDALNDNYGYIQRQSESQIAFVMIDVEGFEQEVLLGAKRLIERRSVLIYQIEVWTVRLKTGLVTSFPGLQLLIDNGYQLYTTTINSEMGYKSCDELTNRLLDISKIFNQTCQLPALPKDHCLGEVFAIRRDVPPLRQWLSACPK
jgi:FkbM family methyltransferase